MAASVSSGLFLSLLFMEVKNPNVRIYKTIMHETNRKRSVEYKTMYIYSLQVDIKKSGSLRI